MYSPDEWERDESPGPILIAGKGISAISESVDEPIGSRPEARMAFIS
jgi:hypothetical protein